MNLQELQKKLKGFIDEDYANENKINTNNLLLYIKAIKKTEPNEYLVDILDNRYKEKNIYVDYSEEYGGVYFSLWSTDEGRVDLNFIILPTNLLHKPKPSLSIEGDNFFDVDAVIANDWPQKYILFDEKVFNQFMNPFEKPEFLNWKSSPWGVKE